MITRRNFIKASAGGVFAFVGAAGLTGKRAFAGQETAEGQVPASEKKAATLTPKDGKAYWSQFTVCIDPGHANRADGHRVRTNPYKKGTQMRETGGTSGRRSGAEYKVNMEVAKYLRSYLQAYGVKVVMTKTRHSKLMSNKERAAVANKCKADLSIRIHCDGAPSGVRGFMTCMPGKSGYQGDKGLYKKSQQASKYMHKRICKALGARNRGCQKRSDLAGFNWCKRPSVLFEIANMGNASDDAKLARKGYKKKVAKAMCSATLGWLKKQ